MLLVVGEPGIGKTRTVEELGTYARMRGAQVLWGRCHEGEGAPPYWPWVQIVRAYVHDREPSELMSDMGPGAADIADVVSVVRERLPGLPTPPSLEPFTEMTQRLGDLEAREVIRTHNRIVREQLLAHGGYEVELQGDGFLLAFGSARRALQCAIAIQRELDAHNQGDPRQPIRVRIGLHTGEALRDAEKFFGRTVILASRIAAQARGGEILVSSVLKELTRSMGDLRFGEPRPVALKGIAEAQEVSQVEWRVGSDGAG